MGLTHFARLTAILLLTMGIIAGSSFSSVGAQPIGLMTTTPSRTSMPTSTPSPTPTLPDLTIIKSDSPDPAIAGTILTYAVVVVNQGRGASPATTVVDELPGGLRVYSLGPGCYLLGESTTTITCQVPTLATGGRVSFTILASITAPAGSAITNAAVVDPSGFVTETDKSNNIATTTTIITAGTSLPGTAAAPTPLPPAPPPPTELPAMPTSTPVSSVATLIPPGAPIAPGAPITLSVAVPAVESTLWLLVTAEVPIFSPTNALLGVARAGEWYKVARVEGAWALAYWEGDAPTNLLWMELGPRIQLTAMPRQIPTTPPTERWLAIRAATQTYTPHGAPRRIATAGELYRILAEEAGWALAVRDADPLAMNSWIEIDARVTMLIHDPPRPTGLPPL